MQKNSLTFVAFREIILCYFRKGRNIFSTKQTSLKLIHNVRFHRRAPSSQTLRIYALQVLRQLFVMSSNDPRAAVIGLSTFFRGLSLQSKEACKVFYDARFLATALLQDTSLSTTFEIKFQIKIEASRCSWHRTDPSWWIHEIS